MPQENPQLYYLVVDEQSTGPYTLEELLYHPKLTSKSLVWKPGISDWVPAETLPELAQAMHAPKDQYQTPPPPEFQRGYREDLNPFAGNPQYQESHTYRQPGEDYYRQESRYNRDYRPAMRTNWLPWAIVATIVGFFASCIGAIFGIIAIVQANRANTFYSQGFDREGDAANSNAKIMTIIGLIFAGVGILGALFFSGLISNLNNLSYL